MKEYNTYLKSNLSILRMRKNLGFRELGRETGISYNKIYRIEKGKTLNPFIADIDCLAKYFGISIDDLLHKDLR